MACDVHTNIVFRRQCDPRTGMKPDPFTGTLNDKFAQGLLMIIGRKERGELLGPTILTQVISLL
jgi:hypothetical protein